MPDTRLDHAFFAQPAIELAQGLLGTIMVRTVGAQVRRARIVEVEAYLGPRDLASHSSKGRTARTEIMFGPPGHAYVYFIYGMHWMFNIVCGVRGEAHAVLIRAAPRSRWTDGKPTCAGPLGSPARLRSPENTTGSIWLPTKLRSCAMTHINRAC